MNDWLQGARPRTLPAAVVPVLVGTACAAGVTNGGLIWWRAGAAMVVAVALQVATNFANDYSDGKRGTDDPGKRVGPVRLVGWGIKPARSVKRAAMAMFLVAGVVGGSLAIALGPEVVVVGILSMLAGWFYTGGPRPYGYLGLGEVFVFVFFGLVATVGSSYVQLDRVQGLAVAAAIPVGLLATALLVINNLRDIPGDTCSGKRTLAVRLGDHRTRLFYVAFLLVSYLLLIPICGLSARPAGAVAFLSVLLARQPVHRVLAGARGADLIPVLAATAKVQLAFGLLLAVGLAANA